MFLGLWVFLLQSSLCADVVKQVLLRVTVMGGEVCFNERLQALGGWAAFGEVELVEGF